MSDKKYITPEKAKRLTRGHIHCMNFIYWTITCDVQIKEEDKA